MTRSTWQRSFRLIRSGMAFLLAGALALTLSGAGRAQESAARAKAPDFTLKNLDGKSVRLSDFKDKVVILDFWATWCPPCRNEIPHFIELQEKYGSRGLAVVGVSVDQGGAKAVKPFAASWKVNYAMLLADARVGDAYGGIQYLPTTFIIDRKGQIVKRLVGYQSKELLEREIEPLLKDGS
jgi:cytochrome c biogenesis protein CcmG/thiol:disulfide interchange protein DsbE